jgi:hypothetical protein
MYVFVYSPVAEAGIGVRPLAPRSASLDGKVIGFLNNGKLNADRFIHRLGGHLVEQHGASRYVIRYKPSTSMPAPPRTLEELADGCDAVVGVWGD